MLQRCICTLYNSIQQQARSQLTSRLRHSNIAMRTTYSQDMELDYFDKVDHHKTRWNVLPSEKKEWHNYGALPWRYSDTKFFRSYAQIMFFSNLAKFLQDMRVFDSLPLLSTIPVTAIHAFIVTKTLAIGVPSTSSWQRCQRTGTHRHHCRRRGTARLRYLLLQLFISPKWRAYIFIVFFMYTRKKNYTKNKLAAKTRDIFRR